MNIWCWASDQQAPTPNWFDDFAQLLAKENQPALLDIFFHRTAEGCLGFMSQVIDFIDNNDLRFNCNVL